MVAVYFQTLKSVRVEHGVIHLDMVSHIWTCCHILGHGAAHWTWCHTLTISPGEAEERNLISKVILGYKARLSQKTNKQKANTL